MYFGLNTAIRKGVELKGSYIEGSFMWKLNKLTFLSTLLFGASLWSQSLVLPLDSKYQYDSKSSFSVKEFSRVGSQVESKLNSYTQLGYKASGKTYDVNITWVPEEESMPYVDAPEFYYEVNEDIQLGRKLYTWNRLDEVFSLSVIQPVFKNNLALPKQQGLTGAWWDLGGVQLYASVVHVPDMGPYFEQKNGTLYSKNPWFKRPVSSVEFQQKDTNIEYSLNIPEVTEMALKPAIGFSTSAPFTKKLNLDVSALYKPMNQIHIELSSPEFVINPEKINVNVFPKVVNHTVFSTQLSYKLNSNTSTYASYIYDQPESNEIPSDWEQAVLYRTQIYGAGIDYKYKNIQLGAHYFQRIDEFPEREKKEIEADVTSSFDRFPYKDAFLLVAGINNLKWNWQMKWQSSANLANSLVYLRSLYRFSSSMNIYADALVIGGDEGFYSNYRENDFLGLGAEYVF